jgi:hypothetical protein
MRRRLIDALQDVIEAERQAAELRRVRGALAELYCDQMLAEVGRSESEKALLQDVKRALRWV